MTAEVKVSEFDYGESDDGKLRVTATVRNETDEPTTVTLIANVTAGKGEKKQELDRSERFEIDDGSSADASFTFDVPYTRFERNGSLDLEVHSERQ
ncbi:hypothetical protein SAMN04487948_103306 [Halogranum amylolyticum]|uniref:CARDB protein n=1 Tax=Halogranum amylolyticum TaxID=660520 RepID=A0A1H8QTF5_9EURY|nr:hypothetical protein [Halogranum amylolyticum]SEO57569.1 hypothetical protein SAMN04487948_103306 [Halogranum amylolyticum]